jgi:ABC-2 type transport system ATP-binding protein
MSNIIEVKNLVKKFKDFVAVDGISFQVARGEVFAFLGPNGAGKTNDDKNADDASSFYFRDYPD